MTSFRKTAKAIMICTMAFFLLLSGSGCGEMAVCARLSPSPPVVREACIQVLDKYVDISLSYPVVSGMEDSAFQMEFNKSVKAEMDNLASRLETEAEASYSQAAAGGYRYHKFTLSSTVNALLNDGTVLCMSVRMENYTGGAHGNSDSRFYTFLNQEPGRPLTIMSLFTKPAEGKKRVEKFINDAIAAHPDEFFPEADVKVSNSTWFYISQTRLHIVFPTYSIAAYAAGEPEFSMPLSQLEDILIPEISN
jgi:hypothetical protein